MSIPFGGRKSTILDALSLLPGRTLAIRKRALAITI